MISDATTFFLVFATVFLSLAAYLWKLDTAAKRLEFRISLLEEQNAADATTKKVEE
jgi:hypothetical protein